MRPSRSASTTCVTCSKLALLAGRSLADDNFLLACAYKDNPEGEAIEAVLKGIEVPLPAGHFFTDHTGTQRSQFRARWWETPGANTHCRDLVFPVSDQIGPVPVAPAAREMFSPYPADARPVFFGHYLKPPNSPIRPERHNVACLDHSGATDGPLVAYRWQGEASIQPEHYICHS